MATTTTRNRSPPLLRLLPRSLLLVALTLLTRLGCVNCGQFTNVSVVSPYPARFAHFAFAWAGAIWVAGGFDNGQGNTVNFLNDVWGSYDFGRSWQQPKLSSGVIVNLPGQAFSDNNRGVLYNDAVYIVSGSHGDGTNNNQLTYVSRDPALASWTTLNDGCGSCAGFTVERMAVPFDGVGTLILVNDGSTAHVYWQSATGNFQSTTPTVNTWTPWKATTAGAKVYNAPWGIRGESATATDAEGLVLILTGGDSYQDDVWQLSWASSFDAPLAYRVTASPGWEGRFLHLAQMVHDWLFIYGGEGRSGAFDDAWMSGDYGVTWTLYNSAATGTRRRDISGLSLGRRLFITGGKTDDGTLLHDVYVSYW